MIRILIADDEMIERAVLCKTLKTNLGDRCAIYQAGNGREALKVYEEEKIQIAILDIAMPGISGIEAAETIRKKDKDCCIIFLTAFDEFTYARRAVSVRAMDYLLKPYTDQELMLVVEEAVHQVEQRTEQENAWRRLQMQVELMDAENQPEPAAEAAAEGENSRLSQVAGMVNQYLQENYMYDISMQDLAKKMNYSEAYFCSLFKQCFGKNFTPYLTEYRVEQAKKLLAQPTVNIKEAGRAVGYGDSNYFAKVFKRITGQSPTEYRAELFRKKN